MVAALLLLCLNPVPTGAYGLPELCRVLSVATGKPHIVDAGLSDYAVFVSVKSGDPSRVRKLVSVALHGQWVEDGGRFRLKSVKPAKDEDYPEFERLYRQACNGNSILLQIPVRDLYNMEPGTIIRYATEPNPYTREMPAPLAKLLDGTKKSYCILREAAGIFVHESYGSEFQFSGLPPSVADLVGVDLQKEALSEDQRKALGKMGQDLSSLKIDWKHLETRDPIAALNEMILKPTSGAMSSDLVIALPDMSIFAVVTSGGGPTTIEAILGRYSSMDIWTVSDGAAVARLPACELSKPSQAKRSVLQRFLEDVNKQGVVGVEALSAYVANQRPGASDNWTDAMLLVLANVVIDEEYIGDYPFNMRLYSRFDKDDWAALRSRKPFAASLLSSGAQKELMDVLLQARSRLTEGVGDPAFWKTLDFSQLTVTASIEEAPVLIGFTLVGGEVRDVAGSGMQYESRRKSLGHEPLYQPAKRRKLVLKISSPSPEESITTGFSEVDPGDGKPVAWKDLPADMVAEFKKAMEDIRRARSNDGRGSPPPFR